MSKRLLGVLLVCGLCGGLTISAQEESAKNSAPSQSAVQNVLVIVDGQAITKDDLYLAMIQSYRQQADETLNRLANEILISKEADRKKVTINEGELKKRKDELGLTTELLPMVKRMIETSLIAEKMIIAEKNIKVEKNEVKKFFDEKKASLGEQEQVHLRQIFVSDENEAKDIIVAIKSNADFSKMASAKSQDAASKEKGGDLGFFARGMLVPEIEKVVFDMKVGDISSAIKTSAGFHVVKVEDRKEAVEAKFDAVMKKRIEKILLNNKIQQELPGWLDNLKKKAGLQ